MYAWYKETSMTIKTFEFNSNMIANYGAFSQQQINAANKTNYCVRDDVENFNAVSNEAFCGDGAS